jgi:predicted metal-binding membrane protein
MSVAATEPPRERAQPALRALTPAWIVLVALAVLAWVVTVQQAREMGIGPGTMGMALPAFLLLWVVMMAAMMFPSVAPVAVTWVRSIRSNETGGRRTFRLATFVAGYLIAWTAFGIVAFVALLGAEQLVEHAPEAAKWLAVVIFATAGIYQLTPLKRACLRHCRAPMMQFLHYANFKGRLRDLRVGIHHGVYCVGCCWGLMAVLIAVGAMNVAAMVALAAVIFIEKLWRRGEGFSKAVGVVFILIALAIPFAPGLAPALREAPMPAMGSPMDPMTDGDAPTDGM